MRVHEVEAIYAINARLGPEDSEAGIRARGENSMSMWLAKEGTAWSVMIDRDYDSRFSSLLQ